MASHLKDQPFISIDLSSWIPTYDFADFAFSKPQWLQVLPAFTILFHLTLVGGIMTVSEKPYLGMIATD